MKGEGAASEEEQRDGADRDIEEAAFTKLSIAADGPHDPAQPDAEQITELAAASQESEEVANDHSVARTARFRHIEVAQSGQLEVEQDQVIAMGPAKVSSLPLAFLTPRWAYLRLERLKTGDR